jgi:glycerol uptake facilitator protein
MLAGGARAPGDSLRVTAHAERDVNELLAEVIGTAILILLGQGVVENAVLRQTKGEGAGWITITWGWGMAVFVAVFVVGRFSGAHLNPAVTLGLTIAGKFEWVRLPGYVGAQMLGAFVGATVAWFLYRPHFAATTDPDAKLAAFCTGPAIRSTAENLATEVVATFMLVFGVLFLAAPEVGLGALDALPVGLLVFAIGMSLGGTTGYAINPARDLGPRVAHAVLPIPGKRDSDWRYAWIPVLGPLAGGTIAALAYRALG